MTIDNVSLYIKEVEHLINVESKSKLSSFKESFGSVDTKNFRSQSFNYWIDARIGSVIFDSRCNEYLPIIKNNKSSFIFDIMHPEFLEDYYRWCKSILQICKEPLPSDMENYSYRINLPIKLKSNEYYWSFHEYSIHHATKEIQIIGVNITILFPYTKSNGHLAIDAEVWNKNKRSAEYTSKLHDIRRSIVKFQLSPALTEITSILHKNPHLTNQEIADQLKKTKNNIDMQKKVILSKARESFRYKKFETVKDVVGFLEGIGWFV